ncbi:MAG: alpha/beta fold hydrolase [Proteobacteria bacterium]|nr:alpha/beta fold hydrolase [Pseudomonadota bacterium]
MVLGLAILFNYLAAIHVYSLTQFAEHGKRSPFFAEMTLKEKVETAFFGLSIPKPRARRFPHDVGLNYQSIVLKTSDGVSVRGWDIRASPTKGVILMLHGYGGEKSRLLDEAIAFIELGLHPILIDFRGHGESDSIATTIGYKEVEEIKSALQFIRKAYPGKEIFLYGKSMGAAAALRAAGPGQEKVSGLILECPFDGLVEAIRNRMYFFNAPRYGIPDLLMLWGSILGGFNGYNHNPTTYAEWIRVPTLMMGGADDSRAKPEEIEKVYLALPSSQKKLKIFSRTGHNDIFQKNKRDWKSNIQDVVL